MWVVAFRTSGWLANFFGVGSFALLVTAVVLFERVAPHAVPDELAIDEQPGAAAARRTIPGVVTASPAPGRAAAARRTRSSGSGDELSVRLPRADGPTEPGGKEAEWLPKLASASARGDPHAGRAGPSRRGLPVVLGDPHMGRGRDGGGRGPSIRCRRRAISGRVVGSTAEDRPGRRTAGPRHPVARARSWDTHLAGTASTGDPSVTLRVGARARGAAMGRPAGLAPRRPRRAQLARPRWPDHRRDRLGRDGRRRPRSRLSWSHGSSTRTSARDAFREALPTDDATWERARGWVLSQAVAILAYYTPENNRILYHEAENWLELCCQSVR